MQNTLTFGKKAFTWTVVVATIAWAMSAAFIAIPLTASAATMAGDLIVGTARSTSGPGRPVYYVGSDMKKYLFPSSKTYAAWYGTSFAAVKELAQSEVDALVTGDKNATAKPGSCVSFVNENAVYVVDGTSRRLADATACPAASTLSIPEGFRPNYTVGAAWSGDRTALGTAATSLGTVLGLAATAAAPAAPTGALSVAVASDSPAGAVLPGAASSVVVLKFNVTAGATEQTVTGATVKSVGVGAAADFSAVYLYDGALRLTSGRTLGSQTRATEFAGLSIAVPANSTKTLSVVADVNSLTVGTLAVAGDTHAFQLTALGTTASVSGLPLTGATQSIGSQGVSAVSVSAGSTPSNPTIGQTGVPISEFRVSAGANDVEFRRITVTIGGTVSVSDLSNFALYQTGTKLADGVRVSDRVTFDISAAPYLITQGANRLFTIKADVGGRGARTITTYVDSVYPTDVLVVDKLYGYGTTNRWGTDTNTTCADEAGVTEFCSTAEGVTVTTQGGRVTVAFNGPPSADASINSQDVPFAKFTLTAGEQPLEIRNLRLNLAEAGAQTAGVLYAAAATPYFTDIKIKDADTGAVIMGPVELTSATRTNETSATLASSALWTLTGTWTLNANQSRKLLVTADLANITTGTDFITRGYTFALNAYTLGDFREISTGQNVLAADVIGLQSAITGNTITVRSSSLTAGVASSPVSGTTVKGTNNVSAVGFALTAGTSSDIKVTQVIVRGIADSSALADLITGTAAGATGANLDSVVLSAQLYDGATAVSSLKSPSSGVITFDNMNWTIPAGTTKNLMVKTNISTTQLDSTADYLVLFLGIGDITAQDKDSNPLSSIPAAQVNATASVATAASVTTTIAAAGTITAAQDAGTPEAAIVLSGAENVPFLKVRLTASNEAFDLTKVSIKNTAAGTSDAIANVKIKYPKADGTIGTATSTLVDSVANFSGLTGYLALDRASVIEVLADMATISATGISGDAPILALDFDTNFEVVGKSGATLTTVGEADIAGNAMTVRKTKPTVTSAVDTNATSGNLGAATPYVMAFNIAADAAGDVLVDRITFAFNASDLATTPTNWNTTTATGLSAADFDLFEGNLSSTAKDVANANWTLLDSAGLTLTEGTAGNDVAFVRLDLTTNSASSLAIAAGTSKKYFLRFTPATLLPSSAQDDTLRIDVAAETATTATDFQWDEINSTSLAGSAVNVTGTLIKLLPVNGGSVLY